jgi:hypothetical protein
MKGFLSFVAALFIAFVVANVLYLWIIKSVDWNFRKLSESQSFRNQSYEILIFGNSTALDGVNPEMLADVHGSSYNFAIGGASLESNFIQLENYLANNQKPKKVLLFLSSCHTNYTKANEIHPMVKHYYSATPFSKNLDDLPLFKYRWLFLENLKVLISEEHRSARLSNGQLIINKRVADPTNVTNPQACPDGKEYSGDGYAYLYRMNQICDELNIAFYVFEMPCWKKYQTDCLEVAVPTGQETFLRITNFNNAAVCDSLFDSNEDWLSENHLNFNGSKKLTSQINRFLLK